MFIFLLSCLLLRNFGVFGIPVSDLNNSGTNQLPTVVIAAKDLGSNLLQPAVKHREDAKKETEGFGSAVLSVYDNSQQKTSNFLNPIPIVDTIQEHEKYGNNGDMLAGLNRGIVNGYEAFSNFVNRLISGPENLIRSFGKKINVPLDNIGARLVGLARK